MTCKIERPDPQVLFDQHLNMFSNTVLGGAEVIPESNEWYAVSVNYAVAENFYAVSEQAWKDRDPRTACCDSLVDIASRDGVYPLAATSAQGYVQLTGVAGTALTSPLNFTIDGVAFTTATEASQPSQIGEDGTATIRVRALIPGIAGNITVDTGTMDAAITDVETDVKVCGGIFCSGTDAEECEALRTRYLARLQYSPRATQTWMLNKLLEWPCATRALVRAGSCCECDDCNGQGSDCKECGCADCGGKLEYYLMFDGTFDCGIAPQSVVDEAQEWLFGSPQGYGRGQVEVGVCGRIRAVTGVPVDVKLDIATCATASQLSSIRSAIAEYFTTFTPSTLLRLTSINTIISQTLGVDGNFDAQIDLVNATDGYGERGYGARTADSKVYIGNCDLEPDCDFMLCLNSVVINTTTLSESSCS